MIKVARRLPFRYFERRKKSNKSHEKNNGAKAYFLYYEESLVSSNLNSKLFGFHCVRPNVHICTTVSYVLNITMLLMFTFHIYTSSHQFIYKHTMKGTNKIGFTQNQNHRGVTTIFFRQNKHKET